MRILELPELTESTKKGRPRRDAAPSRPEIRVLLVDDCPDTIRLLQVYLADQEIALTSAGDGRRGIEVFRRAELPFSLVLMNMEMPVLDGYAATKEIRRWEAENALPRVTVAALTAHSDVDAARRMYGAGCSLLLKKPISRQDLLQAVRRFGLAGTPQLRKHGLEMDAQ